LLLGPIISCVSNIHTIIRWESGIGHTLRRLTRGCGTSIMVRRDTLSQSHHSVVTASTGTVVRRDGATRATALRHHRGPIMLVLMGVLRGHYASIT